jgi:hypothetical protein
VYRLRSLRSRCAFSPFIHLAQSGQNSGQPGEHARQPTTRLPFRTEGKTTSPSTVPPPHWGDIQGGGNTEVVFPSVLRHKTVRGSTPKDLAARNGEAIKAEACRSARRHPARSQMAESGRSADNEGRYVAAAKASKHRIQAAASHTRTRRNPQHRRWPHRRSHHGTSNSRNRNRLPDSPVADHCPTERRAVVVQRDHSTHTLSAAIGPTTRPLPVLPGNAWDIPAG